MALRGATQQLRLLCRNGRRNVHLALDEELLLEFTPHGEGQVDEELHAALRLSLSCPQG